MNTRTAEKLNGIRWAVFLSAFLAVVKAAAGVVSRSTSLLASALDSLMDIGLSVANYLSILKASRPPDHDHAYGHEKIESLASYTQGVVFVFFALLMLGESFRRVITKNFLVSPGLALWTILVSAAVNGLIVLVLHRIKKKTGSLILKAEWTHYFMDILSYLLIFISILLVRLTGWSGWDIVGGLILSGYVAFLAGKILLQAGHELVDRSLPPSELDELDHLIRNHDPHILDYHELRTRRVGPKTFIDFHLVLNARQSFEAAHEITETLIEKIRGRFENADVTVHQDPEHGR